MIGKVLTKEDLDGFPEGTRIKDHDTDTWHKNEDGSWSLVNRRDHAITVKQDASYIIKYSPLTLASMPLPCGAQDYGYSLDPDQDPVLFDPCTLSAGHRGRHSSPQTDPSGKFPNLPPVRWGPLEYQKSEAFPIPTLTMDEVFGDGGLKSLDELVEKGRYSIQAGLTQDGDVEIVYGCNGHESCFERTTTKNNEYTFLDVVDVLKWIDQHEGSHRHPIRED